MATKSILKNIKISDKRLAHTFAESLSDAENERYVPKELTRKCTKITGDAIKDFFGKKNT